MMDSTVSESSAHPISADPRAPKRNNALFSSALAIILIVWCALLWTTTRPESIVSDWNGWRQADTQAIALNFYTEGKNVLYPRIDWRGSGPGYVETEFQLYPFISCIGMMLFGTGIWQGQLLSLLSLAGAAVFIALLCRRYFPTIASLLGMATFLSCLGTLHLATAVQPDAFCFFFYTGSMYFFSKFVNTGRAPVLIASFAFSTLAALVKPPALHLGIIQFLWIFLAAPNKLRSVWLWVHWMLILIVMTAYYLHAHHLYEAYGNTFGIGMGGDSKLPSLNDLFNPKNYVRIVRNSITWGLTGIGAIAGASLLITRKINPFEIAATIGIGTMLVISMRYSSYAWFGSQYHIYAGILGSYLLAHGLNEVSSKQPKAGFIMSSMVACYLIITSTTNTHRRINHGELAQGRMFVALGEEATSVMKQNQLIIVRADAPAQVEGWQQSINNFEDPRLFYLTSAKGWVIPSDFDDIEQLEQYIQQGAMYYIQPNLSETPRITHWLQENATLLSNSRNGSIYLIKN